MIDLYVGLKCGPYTIVGSHERNARHQQLWLVEDEEGNRHVKRGDWLKTLLKRTALEQALEDRRTNKKAKETQSLLREASERIEALEAELEIHRQLGTEVKVKPIQSKAGVGLREATAIAVASDWHVGATVKAAEVNGLNEFDEFVAEDRAAYFFINTLKLVEGFRNGVSINHLVLSLNGDLIQNYLRTEDVEGNSMTPIQEVFFAQTAIASGIRYLLDHSDLRLTIVATTGNHGRLPYQKRTPVHGRIENSLETLLYRNLTVFFKDEPRVQFNIATSNFAYLQVYSYRLRFTHGDLIKFNGGVGGIQVPLQKALYRWNSQIKADHTFIGHFHQLQFGSDFTVNGSLIGIDPYALSIGCKPEKPQQAFQLLDSEFGLTVKAPIFLEEV